MDSISEEKVKKTSSRSAVIIAVFAALIILNLVISVVGLIYITQNVNDHQSKTVLENLEKNLTSMINKVYLNLSKERQFLHNRTVGNFNEWGSELGSVKNTTYRMVKELSIIDRKLDLLPIPDCSAVSQEWDRRNGLFHVVNDGKHYELFCDTTMDGTGWTVFQRRLDGSVDFYRTWEEYASGFGDKFGEFWLGLEIIHQLTKDGGYELRIDLTDWDGSTLNAKYEYFSVSGRSDNYSLTVGNFSGTARDSLSYSSGAAFSAKDKDLDLQGGSCAVERVAAWWFQSCGQASLNGRYNDTSNVEHGVFWLNEDLLRTYSLKASEMRFRKK